MDNQAQSRERFAKACAELALRASQLTAREERFRSAQAEARRIADLAEFTEYAKGLESRGAIGPGTGPMLAAVLSALPAHDTVSFSEGGRQVAISPRDALKSIFWLGEPRR